eukprot:CAMPEP_0180655406 /NCGR_PEP_ID=MMETSP1037_2-20121125/55252_1 /TAXON_ID=632150 /ORGANISM="Azadinium spinosum, Strain 3D9" /LENGTH=108 /DNA_ID=CAMNT_0022681821 /DNA_START=128 /DNA_END=450 /DNA_ORIENTATION=+
MSIKIYKLLKANIARAEEVRLIKRFKLGSKEAIEEIFAVTLSTAKITSTMASDATTRKRRPQCSRAVRSGRAPRGLPRFDRLLGAMALLMNLPAAHDLARVFSLTDDA